MRYIGCLFICLLWLFRATALFAVSNDQKPILIICSYNPAAHQTSVTISDYMEEYREAKKRSDEKQFTISLLETPWYIISSAFEDNERYFSKNESIIWT